MLCKKARAIELLTLFCSLGVKARGNFRSLSQNDKDRQCENLHKVHAYDAQHQKKRTLKNIYSSKCGPSVGIIIWNYNKNTSSELSRILDHIYKRFYLFTHNLQCYHVPFFTADSNA